MRRHGGPVLVLAGIMLMVFGAMQFTGPVSSGELACGSLMSPVTFDRGGAPVDILRNAVDRQTCGSAHDERRTPTVAAGAMGLILMLSGLCVMTPVVERPEVPSSGSSFGGISYQVADLQGPLTRRTADGETLHEAPAELHWADGEGRPQEPRIFRARRDPP